MFVRGLEIAAKGLYKGIPSFVINTFRLINTNFLQVIVVSIAVP